MGIGIIINFSKILIYTFCLNIFFLNISWSGWEGPQELISGQWGNKADEFYFYAGDSFDYFPKNIDVDHLGNIFINDQDNARIKIYNSKGILKYTILEPPEYKGSIWPHRVLVHPTGNFLVVAGKSACFYSKEGKIFKTVRLTGRPFLFDDGYGSGGKLYSISGSLIKDLDDTDIQKLGKLESKSIHKQLINVTAIYPDFNYKFIITGANEKRYIDLDNNIYLVESYVVDEDNSPGHAYRVHKADANTKNVNVFLMPLSKYEPLPDDVDNHPQWTAVPIIEYGRPVVSPNGDIYCWARTKSLYKILKWAWKKHEKSKHKTGTIVFNKVERDIILGEILTGANLKSLNKKEIRLLRNTVFAKYGRKFKSKMLRNWFHKKYWYNIDKAYSDNYLSGVDKKNIATLHDIEKRK